MVKVFLIQFLYIIIIFFISADIITQPRETRWFFWKNLLNKTGLIYLTASTITKLTMWYKIVEKKVTRLFAIVFDMFLLWYIITFIYYSFALNPKIEQTYQGLFLFIYLGLTGNALLTLMGFNLWVKKVKKRRVVLSILVLNVTSYIYLLIWKLATKKIWPGSFKIFNAMMYFLPLNIYLCV